MPSGAEYHGLILKAGAEIVGKSVCEYFCLSGGSCTSHKGIVDNPRKRGYSTGGSSSGSAALLVAGEVDMALGTDQGGSVRIPSSWTGCYGMKASMGVVPYTRGMVMETSIDYTGASTTPRRKTRCRRCVRPTITRLAGAISC